MQHGVESEVFPATNKFDAGHSKWWLTTLELGCLISHFRSWEMVVERYESFASFDPVTKA